MILTSTVSNVKEKEFRYLLTSSFPLFSIFHPNSQYCSTESDVSFEDTHNGYALPYSNGGLVPNTCLSCVSMNDNYEMEVNEMCQQTYEGANYKCEQNMESFNSYYGPDTSGCEYLESFEPTSSKKQSSWGSSKNGNLFQNQPEGVKLAEEYLALLIVSALLGAGFVIFFVQKTVAGEDGAEPKEPSPIIESIKSAAMLVKMKVLETAAKVAPIVRDTAAKVAPIVRETAAKITSIVRGSSSEDDYNNMENDESEKAGPKEEHC